MSRAILGGADKASPRPGFSTQALPVAVQPERARAYLAAACVVIAVVLIPAKETGPVLRPLRASRAKPSAEPFGTVTDRASPRCGAPTLVRLAPMLISTGVAKPHVRV